MPARAPARPANTSSAASLGVLGGHLALLLATHVMLVGILPIGFAVKALRRHEPLAPVAMAVAVLGSSASLAIYSNHARPL